MKSLKNTKPLPMPAKGATKAKAKAAKPVAKPALKPKRDPERAARAIAAAAKPSAASENLAKIAASAKRAEKALPIGVENPIWRTVNIHTYAAGRVSTATSVRETPSGVVVRVTTASPGGVSESLTYVPGAAAADFDTHVTETPFAQ